MAEAGLPSGMVYSASAERRVCMEHGQRTSSRLLLNQAQGAGWHAEAGWLMVNDGQKGPVTSAGGIREDGWTIWGLLA